MKHKITSSIFLMVPLFLFGQMIDNYDALPDSDYWGYEISASADSTLSFVNVSYITDPVSEGAGAMQLDYSAHNIEAWGGYAKIAHMLVGNDDEPGSPIEGTWMLAPEAGALMVGPAANNGEWWTSTEDDVTTRACYFDDEYVFGADGSFQNIQGTETWLEAWQGVESDQCGAPVAPHDGSNAATWDYNTGTGTVTLNGVGAYLGIPKANNAGELPNVDVPETITYDATLSGNTMTLVIEAGTGVFWTFKLVEAGGTEPPLSGTWMLAPEAGALMVGPAANNGEWWTSTEDDVTTRACYFDDEYVFGADGSFQNIQGTETWLEAWQGVESDQCGAPVAPHDGSNAATWDYNTGTGTVTLNGVGAYLGIPKANNAGELPNVDVPETITYDATLSGNTMTLVIEAGTGVFWTFKLIKEEQTVTLTFNLDMSGVETSTEGVFVGGGGTFGNPGDNPMSDDDGDDIWTLSFEFPANLSTDYTFLNGNCSDWSCKEDIAGQECAVDPYNDRHIDLGTDDVTVNACFAVCGDGTCNNVLAAQADDWMTILEASPRDHGDIWDWSGYDSISFSYYNSVPQTLENRVHLRLNLSDFGDIADPANYTGLGEYYYSFHYILDNASGWNTVTMPLERNDSWDGGGFNLTGWSGDAGNGEVDKDAIAGFHLEFSISGGGDGDYSGGTIILDNFTLTGSKNVLTNPGFELADAQDDGSGWGAAMGGGHAEVVTDASMAHSGDNYLSIGVTDNWAVFYSEDSIPAQFGETWGFSGFGKSVSGDDGAGAFFKLEAKDAAGTVLGTTGDVAIAVTDEWENHSVEFVMPEGTVQMAAVIVASRWDGVACDFAFDDMFLMSMGVLDVIAPDPVQNVSAVAADDYNLVTWSDNAGEDGETYNVYASTEPITDLSSPAVDVVAVNVLEGASAAVHYLFNPLEDAAVTYYYAVACKDASNNVGGPGSAEGSITNTAKGVPTISLTPPAAFVADGDLAEWYDSGIVPFELGATENSYGTPHLGFGAVDNDADLYGTIYTAVDENYLYVAAEILDDVVNTDDSGGWWTADVVQICFGFYDQRGPKHVGMERGDEPDYKIYFTPSGANSDNGAGVLAAHGDGNYFHEVFNPDYVFEFRISLDSILIDDDVRLIPANGTRTPFEPMVYDNDGDGLEAIMVLSPTNDDNAHQTCEVWSNTWIGDQSTVDIDKEVIANEFALFPNYPNPFNPVTTIGFSLPNAQQVSLSVYNLIGQEVVSLVNKELPAGYHTINWYAGSMASGVYLSRLSSGGKTSTQKMLLLK
jgi:hypothetical protein